MAVDREFMYIGSAGQADGGKAGRTGGWVGGRADLSFNDSAMQ